MVDSRSTHGVRRTRRDRRGRGVRGSLIPPTVPLFRTRAELFDELVLDVVESLESRWSALLGHVELAVEDVPPVTHSSPDELVMMPDVVEDSTVPLSRLVPGRVDGMGREHAPRIIVYRRPLEVRGRTPSDLAALVREVIVEQIASLAGVDPDEIDPPQH